MNPAREDVNSSRGEFNSEPFIAEARAVVGYRVQVTECILQLFLGCPFEAVPLPMDKDAEVSMSESFQVYYASSGWKIDLEKHSPLVSHPCRYSIDRPETFKFPLIEESLVFFPTFLESLPQVLNNPAQLSLSSTSRILFKVSRKLEFGTTTSTPASLAFVSRSFLMCG